MSLMKALVRVAIGVAVAKGVGAMMHRSSTTGRSAGGSAGGGSIFGGRSSPGSAGDLGGVMGDILSGGKGIGAAAPSGGGVADSSGGMGGGLAGGLGGLLESLTKGTGGRTVQSGSGGGLNDVLGGLTKGAGGLGGLGEILSGLAGGMALDKLGRSGAAAPAQTDANTSFGDVLNQAFGNKGEPEVAPTPAQDAAAGLMLRAMIMAAKSDGKIDAAEKDKLLKNLADATPEEMDFVKQELAAPVDVNGLVRQVPQGLEAQVYAMSVLAIDLDNQAEAQYLNALASGMGLDHQTVNAIHAKVGVPPLYS